MASMRSAMSRMPEAAASAASPPGIPEPRARLRSCCRASLASDNSSAMTSAERRISRASPIWPKSLANSAILASTYCARRRILGSCPSTQLRAKSRPFTLTSTWPKSVLPFEQLRQLGDPGVDPPPDFAGCRPCMRIAKTRQQVALIVDDADPRPEIGAVAVDWLHRAKLADVADRPVRIRHKDPARAVQIVPLRLVFAVAVEYLDAMVLAVGD